MDSLKTLLDNRNYELIIKITEKSKNSSDIFYRIAAFMCLGKYTEALKVIKDNQEILNERIEKIMPVHIQLLCTLEKYEEAYQILAYYSNLPYQSQEVEELLQKMPEYIENQKRQNHTIYYSDEDITEKLQSNHQEDVIFALDLLKKRDAIYFLDDLKKILTSFPNQTIRSLTLMLLVEKEVDRDLKFLSDGALIDVNPKRLKPPFHDRYFNSFVNRFNQEFKDPTLSKGAIHILSNYAIFIYPKFIELDTEEIYLAIYIKTNQLFMIETDDIETICESKKLDSMKVRFYLNKIDLILNDV